MKTNTGSKIVEIIFKNGRARAHDLVRELNLSNVAVHKQLKKLVIDKELSKIGSPPLVYYVINNNKKKLVTVSKHKAFLKKHYLRVTPQGEMLFGVDGFIDWVEKVGKIKEVNKLIDRYVEVRKRADKNKKKGLIDFTSKVKRTMGSKGIDKVYGVDFYSLPEFGKTRLGQLVFYAKQSQNRLLIKKLSEETRDQIKRLIGDYKIEAVVYVPHSIARKLQFLKEYRLRLNLSLPEVNLVKIYRGDVVVAQKSLSKLKERIENARETIVVDERSRKLTKKYKAVLVIDDAIGSGASMNEVAKKLKLRKIAEKVIGFSLIGSYKGFDVIREI